MSYEVAIAIAAADRNRAVRECGARPEPERETCITVAARQLGRREGSRG